MNHFDCHICFKIPAVHFFADMLTDGVNDAGDLLLIMSSNHGKAWKIQGTEIP